MSLVGLGQTDFPSLLGEDDVNATFYDLNVQNQFSISSLGLTNNQFAQLVGINTDETIQQQIDSIIDITNNIGYFGVFYSTIDQTASSTSVVYNATLNTALSYNNGVILNDQVGLTGNYNSMKILNDGTYNFEVSLHISSSNANTSEMRAWLRKNGTDIVGSCSVQTTHNNNTDEFMSFNYILPLLTDDVISIMWGVNDVSMFLNNVASRTTPFPNPQSPSVFVSVQQVLWYQDNSVALAGLQTEVSDLSANYYDYKNTNNTRVNDLEIKTTDMSYNSLTLTTDINGNFNVNGVIRDNGTNIFDIYAPRGLCYTKTQSDNLFGSKSLLDSTTTATALNTTAIATYITGITPPIVIPVNFGGVSGLNGAFPLLVSAYLGTSSEVGTQGGKISTLEDRTKYISTGTSANETSLLGTLLAYRGSGRIDIDPENHKISSFAGNPLIIATNQTLSLDGNDVDVNASNKINLNSVDGVDVNGTFSVDNINSKSGTTINLSTGSMGGGSVNIGQSLDLVSINNIPFSVWFFGQWVP
jgi:hypothetical protein